MLTMIVRSIVFSCCIVVISIGSLDAQSGDKSRLDLGSKNTGRLRLNSIRDSDSNHGLSEDDIGDEFEPSRVLAIVGGEPIFVGDVLFEINQLIARFMPDAPAAIVKRERGALIQKMLPKYIEQKLLLIDVKTDLPDTASFDDIIESASADFDDKAMEGLMEAAGVDSPTTFDAHLRAQGSSLRKMRRTWTVNQIVRYFLSQKIKSDAEVSHQELLDYYREHTDNYSFKARARWEQIMVRREKFSSISEAMNAIIDLGNKIVYGASLKAVAKKSSHGFEAADGGQHDWTTRGSLVLKELDKAIFTLPIGQLSDVIKTKDGFHIVRVIERRDAGKIEFLEAQVEIRKKLEAEKRIAAFEAHVEKLRKAIPVEITSPNDRSAKRKQN